MDLKAPHILIVDDDAENGRFLEKELSADGCYAQWFSDPREALSKVEKGIFQVGILDLKMPHMDGVELFHRIREKDSDIGLIILTGYPDLDSALATLREGAYDYVRKPYRFKEVQTIVHRLLESKGTLLNLEKVDREIGQAVKRYRTQRDWTLIELGQRTGFSKSLLSQIENGKSSASIESLARIAHCLGVRMRDLIGDL